MGLFTFVFADGTPGTTALTKEACDWVTTNIRIPRCVVSGTAPLIMGKAVVDKLQDSPMNASAYC